MPRTAIRSNIFRLSNWVLASVGCATGASYFYRHQPWSMCAANDSIHTSPLKDISTETFNVPGIAREPFIKTLETNAEFALPGWTQAYFTKPEYYEVQGHGYRKTEGEPFLHVLHDVLVENNGISNMRYFIDTQKTHIVFVCTVGPAACGHKGVAHGGFTATVIDNVLGALAYASCSPPMATKSLSISYKAPVMAYETVVLSGDVEEIVDFKKAVLKATLYGPEGKPRVKAEGVFVHVGNKWKVRVNEIKGTQD